MAAKRAADDRALALLPTIRKLMTAGFASDLALADELNRRGITGARGGRWHRITVRRLLTRLSKAVTTDQPFEFDLLQNSVKHLNQLMENLTDVVDMADDLVVLAPKNGDATGDLLGRLGRQARAYRAMQPIINAAMAQGVEVESRMTAFLKESPELARNLARWQAE